MTLSTRVQQTTCAVLFNGKAPIWSVSVQIAFSTSLSLHVMPLLHTQPLAPWARLNLCPKSKRSKADQNTKQCLSRGGEQFKGTDISLLTLSLLLSDFQVDCGNLTGCNSTTLLPTPPNHYHHQNSFKFHYIIQCSSWDSGREAMETQHDIFHFPTKSRESHRPFGKRLLSGAPNSPQVVHMHTQLESGTFHSTAAAPLSHPQKVASTKSQVFMAMPTD